MTWITASFPFLAQAAVNKIGAVTTTRENGVSLTPFNSFNLATHVGDNLSHVLTNRAILRDYLSQDVQHPSEPFWLQQTHSSTVLSLPNQYFYECATDTAPIADASFTRESYVTCVVMTADCLPLLVVNNDATEVAAIHAGWKGLANGIIEKTMNAMTSSNDQLHVWLGPAIGANAFEVGEDVRHQFVSQSSQFDACFVPYEDKSFKYLADIYQIAKLQLHELGITHISGGDYCTYSQPELFFSYRREGQTGRMASLIWIKQ